MEPCFPSGVLETEASMKKCPSLGTFAIVLLVAYITSESVHAEITTTTKQNHHTVNATLATDVHATVTCGNAVKIELNAVPCYGTPIAFQIIKSPEYGTVTPPERIDDHTVVVTYRSGDFGESSHDSFLFRVKAPGRPASIAYSADIKILSAPERVSLNPKVMDFGSVMLSQKKQMTLLVSNEGRSRVRGRLVLPLGFTTLGDTMFDLTMGQSIKIPLEFAPQEPKIYASTLTSLPEIEGLNLEMRGVALSRFEVTKRDSKSCEVKNISDAPLMISFSGGAGLIMPRDEVLPPSGKKAFEFQRRSSNSSKESHVSRHDSPVQIFLSDGLSRIDLEVSPPSPKPTSGSMNSDLVENLKAFGKLNGKAMSTSPGPRTTLGQVTEMDSNVSKEVDQSSDGVLLKQTAPTYPLVPGARCSVGSSWMGRHFITVSWDASAAANLIPKVEEISMVLTSPMDAKKEIFTPSDYPTYRVQSRMLTSIVRRLKNEREEGLVRDPGPGWKTIELSLLGPEGIPTFASQFQLFIPPDSPWSLMKKVVLATVSFSALGFLLSKRRKTSKGSL